MAGVYYNMQDLTVIYLTANQHPVGWQAYHILTLLEAIQELPLIVVSREDKDAFHSLVNTRQNTKLMLDKGKKCHANMYFQLLQAAKQAETEYIATAEDDALYPKEHFTFHRPKPNAVAYDMARWSLFTWSPELYSLKQRVSNCTLIAPRKYLIEALEERFNKYTVENFPPQLVSEVGRYEGNMGITIRNMEKVYCKIPTIHLNHPNGSDSTEHRKAMGEVKAYNIPYWGKAEEIVKRYV
jgi:hypothetical protein